MPPPAYDPFWWLKGPGPLAVVGNVFYLPAKVAFATIGGLATGVTYVATIGDGDAAGYVWRTSTGGDYLITPRMVHEGALPQFIGPVQPAEPSAEQTR